MNGFTSGSRVSVYDDIRCQTWDSTIAVRGAVAEVIDRRTAVIEKMVVRDTSKAFPTIIRYSCSVKMTDIPLKD